MEDIGLSTDKCFRLGINRAEKKRTDAIGGKADTGEGPSTSASRSTGLSAAMRYSQASMEVSFSEVSPLSNEISRHKLRNLDLKDVEDELYFVNEFVSRDIWHEGHMINLPWREERQRFSSSPHTLTRSTRAESVRLLLHLNADGSSLPLTICQNIRYKNARHRIKTKILRSRRQAEAIVSQLSGLNDSSEAEEKDSALMQYFIMEQFSAFKRLSLRRHFFNFDELTPDSIAFWKWLLAWSFLILSGLFYMYWILAWALYHGAVTAVPWFIQIIFFLVQEGLIHQCLEVYLVNVLALELLRPQLVVIRNVLINVAKSKIRSNSAGVFNNAIIQHISGKCHILIMFLLMQHSLQWSGACRAARSSQLAHLPAAQVLQRIDDEDAVLCRTNIRQSRSSAVLMFFVGFLTALALASDFVHDMVLELVIPCAWCLFLVGNALLASTHYLYLILIYIAFAVILFIYIGVIRPVLSFIDKHKESRPTAVVLDEAKSYWTNPTLSNPSELYKQNKPTPKQTCCSPAKSAVMDVLIWCRLLLLGCYSSIARCRFHFKKRSDLKGIDLEWQNMNRIASQHCFAEQEAANESEGGLPSSLLGREEAVTEKNYKTSRYVLSRRGFIPPELSALTKAHSLDVAFKFDRAVKLSKEHSQYPEVSRRYLPTQCPGLYSLESAQEMLGWKFEELLDGYQSDVSSSGIPYSGIVLPTKEACECASYVLSSFHIYNKLLSEEEFCYFSDRLSERLEESGGYINERSMEEWLRSCTQYVTNNQRPPLLSITPDTTRVEKADKGSDVAEESIVGRVVVATGDGKGSYTSFEMMAKI